MNKVNRLFKCVRDWFYYFGNSELKGFHRWLDDTAKIESQYQQFVAYNNSMFYGNKPCVGVVSLIEKKDDGSFSFLTYAIYRSKEGITQEIMNMDYDSLELAEKEHDQFKEYFEIANMNTRDRFKVNDLLDVADEISPGRSRPLKSAYWR
jgi:hypothetical protein